jgi:hypothetical protein
MGGDIFKLNPGLNSVCELRLDALAFPKSVTEVPTNLLEREGLDQRENVRRNLSFRRGRRWNGDMRDRAQILPVLRYDSERMPGLSAQCCQLSDIS